MGFQHTDSYRQCTATSKRSQQRCKAPAMRGRSVCRFHGGKSRRGFNSATFSHGYYSKDWYSRFMWSVIKRIWRDCIQDVRLREIPFNPPKSASVRAWRQYANEVTVKRRKVLHAPIPDIPSELHKPLWDCFENGHSGSKDVRTVVLEYLTNNTP